MAFEAEVRTGTDASAEVAPQWYPGVASGSHRVEGNPFGGPRFFKSARVVVLFSSVFLSSRLKCHFVFALSLTPGGSGGGGRGNSGRAGASCERGFDPTTGSHYLRTLRDVEPGEW